MEAPVDELQLGDVDEGMGIVLPDDLDEMVDLVARDDHRDVEDRLPGIGARGVDDRRPMGQLGHEEGPEPFLGGRDFDLHFLVSQIDLVDDEAGGEEIKGGVKDPSEGEESRLALEAGIGCGENLTSNGLSIFKLEEKKALTIDGVEYTLLEALALDQYGKVYLSLGVNELGYFDDQGFYDNYCKAIDDIRALQPNAVIYIQGLIPLNEGQIAATTGRTYLTNDHLRIYNDLMKKAAQEKQVVYLDLYSEFVDENGALPEDGSHDGVHLTKAYCQRWLEYLKTHTVDYDTLYPDGAA